MILFVDSAQVGTPIDQKFNHVILVAQDGIIDGPLFLHIGEVEVGTEIN